VAADLPVCRKKTRQTGRSAATKVPFPDSLSANPRSRSLVEVTERWLDGRASDEAMDQAVEAVRTAQREGDLGVSEGKALRHFGTYRGIDAARSSLVTALVASQAAAYAERAAGEGVGTQMAGDQGAQPPTRCVRRRSA